MTKANNNASGKFIAWLIIVQCFIFLFLLVFYIKICPLVIYDADDWIYFSQPRIPLPIWHGWNPSRVLPETLQPIVGYFSVYIIYPLVGNYVKSITVGAALCFSFFITLLCYCVNRFLTERLNVGFKTSMYLEVIFLALCFMIFRNRGTSRYLFYAASLNCTFFYTISGIMNAITILIMMRYSNFEVTFREWSISKKSIFVILVYLSVFSNLFHSGMIAVYCFICIMYEMSIKLKNHEKVFNGLFKRNTVHISIIITWVIAVVFELSGGRANRVDDGQFKLLASFQQLKAMLLAVSRPFVIMSGILVIIVFASMINRHLHKGFWNEDESYVLLLIMNIFLITVYLLVLCSKVLYMSRIEASWAIWFYMIMIDVVCLADIIKLFPRISVALPAMIIIMVVFALYPDGRFMISTLNGTDYSACVKQDYMIINPIIEADKNMCEKVTVTIPDHSAEAEHSLLSDSLGQCVANAMYNHGLIRNRIKVTTRFEINN